MFDRVNVKTMNRDSISTRKIELAAETLALETLKLQVKLRLTEAAFKEVTTEFGLLKRQLRKEKRASKRQRELYQTPPTVATVVVGSAFRPSPTKRARRQ